MSTNWTYIWIQVVYFGISIGSVYCVYVDGTYCDMCVRVVWAMCGVDYVVHFIGWSRLRTDMMIHHAFVSVLIGMLCRYHAFSDLHLLHPQRNLLITTMLSTEISTMFLVVIPLCRPTELCRPTDLCRPTWWNSIPTLRSGITPKGLPVCNSPTLGLMVKMVSITNQILFLATFAYYRLYKYTVNLLTNAEMHRYIYDELTYQNTSSPGTVWIRILYGMTIVGMWILNTYWFVLIVRKACRRVGTCRPKEY